MDGWRARRRGDVGRGLTLIVNSVALSRIPTVLILLLPTIIAHEAVAGTAEVAVLTRPTPVVDRNAELYVQVSGEPVLCSMEVHLAAEGTVRAVVSRMCPSALLSSATETLESWRFLPPELDGLAVSTVWPVSLVYVSGVVVTPVPERAGFELVYVSPYVRPRWDMVFETTSLGGLSPVCSVSFVVDELGLPVDVEVYACEARQVEQTMRQARRWGFEVVGQADRSTRYRMELPAED